ncbi:MAG: hypothetical protein OQK99_14015 [Gammaproteobacteria bacterium]|jgi:hypothetical protein|nr:hypothetical protein [Gammaproteobacteria bacterium]
MQGKFSKTLVDAQHGAGDRKEDAEWEAYRNWLARVASSRSQKTKGLGSLYSWSGYRDWAAKIRKEWTESS